MKKQLLTISAAIMLLTLSSGTFAQNRKVPCATTKAMQDLFLRDPQAKARFEQQDKDLQQIINRNTRMSLSGPVITIPIVIHVIHTGQTQGMADPNLSGTVPNPSPEQLKMAFNLANADLNKRMNKVRYAGGDSAGIKLCLSKNDQTGMPIVNGAITYWDGSKASTWANTSDPAGNATKYVTYGVKADGNTTGEGVTDADVVSVVKWDPAKFYNVYLITQIDSSFAGAGIKGYAFFPGSPSNDYAIMDPSSFSATDVSTFVHEMGHALNLHHTFAGGGGDEDSKGTRCPARESSCDTDGDRCCDIPEHKSMLSEPLHADSDPNTCDQATGSPASAAGTFGLFQHNIMNYGGSANCFSPDQVKRMRATVSPGGARAGQVSQANLDYCGCSDTQVALAAGYNASKTTACANETIVFTNTSTGNINSYSWDFGAGANPATANTVGPHSVTYTTGGTPDVTLTVTAGTETDSKISKVTINTLPEKPTINYNQSNNTLSCNVAADSYQWYRNNMAIAGATSQEYVVTLVGAYYVVITNAAQCSNSSDVYSVVAGIDNSAALQKINVYPNPANDILFVNADKMIVTQLELINSQGQVVLTRSNINAAEKLDICHIAAGMYTLKLKTAAGIQVQKLSIIK